MPTAWDLIGTPNLVKTKGGRTTYEAVSFEGERQTKVRLSRLDTHNGLHQVNRYVDPDTAMEIVPEDMRGHVIVTKTDGERIVGTFDGWFAANGQTTGLQVLVSLAPTDLRYVALDELVSVVEDPYADPTIS